MYKIIPIMIVAIIGFMVFTGCNRQSYGYDLPEGRITEYLPVTLHDQFELSLNFNPFEKRQFTNAELMIIYRAISSFRLYGYSHPYTNNPIFGGVHPTLRTTNEEYSTSIFFIRHPDYGPLATAANPNGEQEIRKWFEVDADAFDEIRALLLRD